MTVQLWNFPIIKQHLVQEAIVIVYMGVRAVLVVVVHLVYCRHIILWFI